MNAVEMIWEQRSKILGLAVAGLVALLLNSEKKISALNQQLEDKPKIETRVETRTVEGPVRIVEKIVKEPGGQTIVERIITREVKTTENNAVHTETPICPAMELPKRWILGGSVDPFHYDTSALLRGGLTLENTWDISVGHSIMGPGRTALDVAWRF